MILNGLQKGLDPGFSIVNQQEHYWIPVPNPTVGGFSSLTVNRGYYRVIGNTVFWWINISGTSNATSFRVEWPFTIIRPRRVTAPIANNFMSIKQIYRVDNGTATLTGRIDIQPGIRFSSCYSTLAGTTWTASGTKGLQAWGYFEIGGM